jgi:hypothetical protein
MRFLPAALLLHLMIHNDWSEIPRGRSRKIPDFFILKSRKLLHAPYREGRVKKHYIMGNKENKMVK